MTKYKVSVFEKVVSIVEYRLVREADSEEAAKELVLDEYYQGLPPEDWQAHSDEIEDCWLSNTDIVVERV